MVQERTNTEIAEELIRLYSQQPGQTGGIEEERARDILQKYRSAPAKGQEVAPKPTPEQRGRERIAELKATGKRFITPEPMGGGIGLLEFLDFLAAAGEIPAAELRGTLSSIKRDIQHPRDILKRREEPSFAETLGRELQAPWYERVPLEALTDVTNLIPGIGLTKLGGKASKARQAVAPLARAAERVPAEKEALASVVDVVAREEPIPETGTIQSGMGIGERPAQGELGLGGRTVVQEPVPLIDAEQVAERQRLAAEQAAGQGVLPEVAPPVSEVAPPVSEVAPPAVREALPEIDEPLLESPLEQARGALDEAVANLKGTLARGLRAPKFGTRERSEFDAARMQESAAGRRFIPKRERERQARQQVREARARVVAEENAEAVLEMAAKDAANLPGSPMEPPVRSFPPNTIVLPDGTLFEGGLQEIREAFHKFLVSPEVRTARELTEQARRVERGRRFAKVDERIWELRTQGVDAETAMRQAMVELRGPLPRVGIDVPPALIAPYIRDALFQEIELSLTVPERIATAQALRMFLEGQAPNRIRGIAGSSAYDRLLKLVGPEIADKFRNKSLEEVIRHETEQGLGLTRPTGPKRPFIEYPSTQVFGTARVLGPLESRGRQVFGVPSEQVIPAEALTGPGRALTTQEAPIPTSFTLVPFSAEEQARRTLGLRLGLGTPPSPSIPVKFPAEPILKEPVHPLMPETPVGPFRERPPDLRALGEKEIELQIFRETTGQAPPPVGPRLPPGTRVSDFPPDDVIRQARMIPMEVSEQMREWAKLAGLNTLDLGGLLRANIASVDLSYLRQMAFLMPGHPVAFAKSFPDALRAVWSEGHARNVQKWITSDPDMRLYEALDLDFLRPQPWEQRTAGKAIPHHLRSEEFMIVGDAGVKPWPRPFAYLAEHIPWVNISARAFATGTNVMNWHIWKGYVHMLERMNEQSLAGTVQLPPNWSIEKSARDFGQDLENMSGRGRLGVFKPTAQVLNNLFFSPRLNAGRMLSGLDLLKSVTPFTQYDKFTRREIWRNWATAVGFYGGLIMAGRYMGLWDVETDARSSDYMKIRVGPLRVDPWGGYQQYAVLFGRLLPVVGGVKNLETGKITQTTVEDRVARFSRTKAAPFVGQVLTAWSGRDFKGSKIERDDWQFWLEQNLPVVIQDVLETMDEFGIIGLGVAPVSALGIGVQVHEQKQMEPRFKLPMPALGR